MLDQPRPRAFPRPTHLREKPWGRGWCLTSSSLLGGRGWGSGKEEWRVDVYPSAGTASNHWLLSWIAYVASVSVQFRSKERGTRVKDRAKNGVSKTAGRGWGRKEGNAGIQTTWVCHAWVCSPTFGTLISCDNWPINCLAFFSFFPLPLPPLSFFLLSFHFSRGQNRESLSSVFLCSETKRKRLLRRLGCEVYAWLTRPIKVWVKLQICVGFFQEMCSLRLF